VDGGCRLHKDLAEISLYDLITVIEGGYEVNACMDPDFSCARRQSGGCSVHPQLMAIQKTLTDQLRSYTLESLLK
jgi:DNA-binding IscR family transcriptional regulator